MKKIIVFTALALCLTIDAGAQNFTDHLQKDEKGSGSVSIKQSDDINNLVNGGKKQDHGKSSEKSESRPAQQEQSSSKESTPAPRRTENVSSRSDEAADKQRREQLKKKRQAEREQRAKAADERAAAVSGGSEKKMMSNSKRVSGYRVQVYAGSNTRDSRAKAHEVGAKLKTQVPGQPIYVHFYSPRWCCRLGNFRNQEDANKMVKRLNKLGYRTACVVKATITVSR